MVVEKIGRILKKIPLIKAVINWYYDYPYQGVYWTFPIKRYFFSSELEYEQEETVVNYSDKDLYVLDSDFIKTTLLEIGGEYKGAEREKIIEYKVKLKWGDLALYTWSMQSISENKIIVSMISKKDQEYLMTYLGFSPSLLVGSVVGMHNYWLSRAKKNEKTVLLSMSDVSTQLMFYQESELIAIERCELGIKDYCQNNMTPETLPAQQFFPKDETELYSEKVINSFFLIKKVHQTFIEKMEQLLEYYHFEEGVHLFLLGRENSLRYLEVFLQEYFNCEVIKIENYQVEILGNILKGMHGSG